jgi:cytochrome b561
MSASTLIDVPRAAGATPAGRHTATAKALHWAIALLLIGLLALGLYMQDLPLSPRKLQLFSWHKWAGVTVFLLTLARVVWRVAHRPPALPNGTSKIAALLAHGGHLGLYALTLVIPVSGWLMSSAKGFQTVWFGVLPLPDLVARSRPLGDLLQQVHQLLAFALVALIAGHVAAALKHHFFDGDDVLRRMWISRTEEQS